jgi:hypothetical protein
LKNINQKNLLIPQKFLKGDYMSKENWDDKAFVLKRVKKDGIALYSASDRLKDDETVVMAAVQEYKRALEYASDRLQDNESIVLSAVQEDGIALYYASDRLQDNESIVLPAVKQDGWSLQYASERLRSDVNFCIECAKKDPDSIAYFLGEAKEIFEAHHNDIDEIEEVYTQQQQNKANEVLLTKISTKQKIVNTTKVFKRKLDV